MSVSLRWRARSLSVREALLAAAADLFAEKGYAGTTVEAVAHRAEANKALISYHFGGKQLLYQAVWSRLNDLLPSPPSLEPTQSDRGPAPTLKPDDDSSSIDVLELLTEQARRHPALPRLLLRVALGDGPETTVGRQVLDTLAARLPGAAATGISSPEQQVLIVAVLYHLSRTTGGTEPLPAFIRNWASGDSGTREMP